MKAKRASVGASKKPQRLHAEHKPFGRNDVEARVRKICRSFPGAFEKEAWGGPTFRAPHGMFAMYVDNHHGDGELAIWCRAPKEIQEIVVGSDPKRYFVPPYVGVKGWIAIRLLGVAVDWQNVTDLLKQGHALASQKRSTPAGRRRQKILAPLESPAAGLTRSAFFSPLERPLYPKQR